ncbi:MAG: phage late control D family protein [Candidatus Zixiibacteriota bacterium]|nr:MAG: phage late control D family protein [candidate division Zixibacteria bacterium]
MEAAFRMWFGDRAATAAELRLVEEIVVEQQEGAIWQAQIKLSLCLDEDGNWKHQIHELAAPFSMVRIEVRVAGQDFVPLIDGPVAGYNSNLSSLPGRSSVTAIIRDVGAMLNREDRQEPYEKKTDREIVEAVFSRHLDVLDSAFEIATIPGDTPRDAFQRDSDYVFLRQLARTHNMQAYVLPTGKTGKSQACFQPPPSSNSTDHPSIVLLGKDRNLVSAVFDEDSESPERTRSRTMRLSDGQLVPYDSSYSDADLMRELPSVPEDVSAIRNMPPAEATREDASATARAQTERRSYNLRMSASVIPCYPAVLRPYLRLEVKAANTAYSGDWTIEKVTHRITPSVYLQEFTAKANSLTKLNAETAFEKVF